MSYNELVIALCGLGLTPDEAETIVRGGFREGLMMLNKLKNS